MKWFTHSQFCFNFLFCLIQVILRPGGANTSSVTVIWDHPNASVDYFLVYCVAGDTPENVTASDAANPTEDMYVVTCEYVDSAGSSFTILVESYDGDQNVGNASIILFTGKSKGFQVIDLSKDDCSFHEKID